jgi:hypothetical protein
MKGWAVIVGILIFGMIFSSGCTQPASSPSTLTTTSIQPTPLVTEQTQQPTQQSTVEVTKTPEKSLPLVPITEINANDETRDSLNNSLHSPPPFNQDWAIIPLSFKLPEGWTVLGGAMWDLCSLYGGQRYEYYVVPSKFAQEYPQDWMVSPNTGRWKGGLLIGFNGVIGYKYITKYQSNAAIIIRVGEYSNVRWQSIVNGLRDDSNGDAYWKTYDPGTIVEDAYIGNSIKAKKVTLVNTTAYRISDSNITWIKNRREIISKGCPSRSELNPYFDLVKRSEKEIYYVSEDGSSLSIEYYVNPQINGKPIETFNPETYEEIIKSFKIEKS